MLFLDDRVLFPHLVSAHITQSIPPVWGVLFPFDSDLSTWLRVLPGLIDLIQVSARPAPLVEP